MPAPEPPDVTLITISASGKDEFALFHLPYCSVKAVPALVTTGAKVDDPKKVISVFSFAVLPPLPQAAVKTRLAPRANTAKNLRVNI